MYYINTQGNLISWRLPQHGIDLYRIDMLSDSEEEDTVVKIENVLDEIDEENCIAMGGIDDKSVCTFIRGYVKRQALYTCRTCLNIDEVKAGICFPCAMECHADHDVVELYTKRRFRCDCGNAKFAGVNGCLLWEEKDDENNLNRYSENFSNRYCTCHRPYPDPDYDGVEEMIQCGICENWFHLEKMYMYFQVEFLLDPEDSVSFYMQLGKQRTKSINDEEKRTLDEALAELPHHVAVNFATGFARLKEALEEFFTKKRGENHVVTESEVRAFFEDFRKRSQS
ncbi:E3 ubiquitin-protein ligase [Schistosoma japonicum]|nr:E3 ubiquitin-protein ligase [Schistosoma japonicum]